MHRKILLSLVVVTALAAVHASAQTADEIIQQNLEAKGGEEAWLAVKSAKITGTMRMGGGAAGAVEAPVVLEFKRPEMVRLEFTMQGMTAIQAYDGKVGWSVMPFMGKTEPEEMAEDQLKDIKEMADLEGPLVNYKDKGHTVEYLGVEEVDGTPAHKLRVNKANGDVVDIFIDEEYFVEFKQESTREVQGNEVKVATVYGDYKEVDGLLFAHSMEMSFGGGPAQQVITLETIELDIDIADERFSMPESATAPTAE
jgi:outer membrane lipoprotein-sorting protein